MADLREKCQEKCSRRTLDINTPMFPGRGNPDADIVFVGECPSQEEDAYGKMFAGVADDILRGILTDLVDINDVYITNAVKCAPISDGKKPPKKPSKKDIGCCREHLWEELKSVKPNVICCMGATALEAVLKRTGITKLCNNVFYNEELGIKVVPVLHPAQLLRNPSMEDELIAGIQLALKESKTKSYKKRKTVKGRYLDANTPELINKVLTKLEKSKKFVFDLETTSLDHREAKILCFSFSWKTGVGVSIPIDSITPDIKKRINRIFRDRKKLKIAHNIKFDLKILRANGYTPRGPYYCTLAGIALVDENIKDKSLDALTLRYTDLGEYWVPLDRFKKQYCKEHKIKLSEFSYAFIPYNILCAYAQKDADVTYRIYIIVSHELNRQQINNFFKKYTIPTLKLLIEIEYFGICVDRKKLKKLSKLYAKKIAKALKTVISDKNVKKLEEILYAEKSAELSVRWANGKTLKTTYATAEEYIEKRIKKENYTFNPNSVQQLRRILFEIMGIRPNKDESTDSGLPSTNVDVLTRLAEEDGVDFCKNIVQYRQLVKFKSTYIDSSIEKSQLNGRLHPTYKQHYVVTGRLSSSNPNFQNIPRDAKDYKSCLIADEGYTLVKADLAQAEFRCWAHYSNDRDMINDIEAGLDIHKRTASEIYNITEEEVTKDQRTFAKNCVFGFMYGRGVKAVAAQYGIDVMYAQKVKRIFFERYPKAATWLKKQVAHARAHGYVKTWMGRIRRLPEIYSQDHFIAAEAERQAKNSPIQGLASDMNNYYGVRNLVEIRKNKIDAHPIGLVHDANFLQVRDDQVSDLVGIMNRVVADAFPEFKVTMKLDVEIGKNLGEMTPYEEWAA